MLNPSTSEFNGTAAWVEIDTGRTADLPLRRDEELEGRGTDEQIDAANGADVVTDFKIKKDGNGLVNALDLSFIQKGNDLLMKDAPAGVKTLLINIERDTFLEEFLGHLQLVPAVEVDVF